MMSSEPIQVTVRILDKDYAVACPHEEEKQALIDSARLLDDKMREIRAGSHVVGTDRIAVMAALNLAYELLQERNQENGYNDLDARLRLMQERIDAVLGEEEPPLSL